LNGKGHNVRAALVKCPVEVRTSATRTTPSPPAIIFVTRPKRHFNGGMLSSRINTTVLTFSLGPLTPDHLFLSWGWFKYSRLHFCQIVREYCVTLRHHVKWLVGIFDKSGSGMDKNDSPIRKWPRVKKDTSFGSDAIGVIGREFKQASARVSTVLSSSKCKWASPTVFCNKCFIDLTAASHNPPKCGDRGGMKRHWTPTSVKASCTFFLCCSELNRSLHYFIFRFAPTKLVALSVKVVTLLPRRSKKRFNALMNAAVLKSPINSIRTAFVEKQTKIHTYPFVKGAYAA